MPNQSRRSGTTHHRLAVVLLALVPLIAGACGGGGHGSKTTKSASPSAHGSADLPQTVVDAAKAEGEVVWYTATPNPTGPNTGAAFTAKYGIKVTVIRNVQPTVLSLVQTEADAGHPKSDVVNIGTSQPFVQTPKYFLPLNAETVPALKDWPTKFALSDGVALSIGALGFGYNTSLVKGSQVPTDWKVLISGDFKGKVLAADPRALEPVLEFFNFTYQKFGSDYLQKFAAQHPTFLDNNVSATQQMAAGASPLSIPQGSFNIAPLQAQGAPIALSVPNVTTGIEFWGGIIQNAPHPNAARLFFNWLMTPEGQSAFNTPQKGSSVLSNVTGATPLPSGYISPDWRSTVTNKPTILRLLGLPG